ncbi:MAG: hypothetical protein M1829_001052 [Trizodia sp. TS-e1964]|nr:MAG: hypothetical protein M1829_001052 [Trizodia sp. TS-e1964]
MINFFSKTPSKSDKKPKSTTSRENSTSPRKKSPSRTSSLSNTPSTTKEREREREREFIINKTNSNSNSTSTPSRHSKRPKAAGGSSTSSRNAYDPTSHPLNLPPDELNRRLSAMSAMSESPTMMEVDHEMPSSPVVQSPLHPPPSMMSGSFPMPQSNKTDGSGVDNTPVPPPHKVPLKGSTPPPAADPEAFKAAGNTYFKLKEYGKAIAEYTKAIDADPRSPTYLSNRSAALIELKRFNEALADSKAADALKPNDSKILLRLARIYTSLGRPAEALEVYARIRNPPATLNDKAKALEMMNYITQAENSLREGTTGSMALHALDRAELELGSGVDRPRKWKLMRGEAYLKMGGAKSLGEALNVAISLLRANNADPDALLMRGRAYYGQGENDKAMKHFREALSYDPDFKDAVQYLRKVQRLERLKEEGNAAFKLGRYQHAADLYSQALLVDPADKGTNPKILQNRAMCSIKLKDFNSAQSDCKRAIELDPKYLKPRKTLAKALGEAGNWEESVREWKKIGESHPGEPGLAKEIRAAELELKKSSRKDYYKILGVSKDAGEGEVKKCYRKLAMVHHPDKNPDDEAAAEKFKEIQEAYETLIDSDKRQRYDNGDDLIDPSDMFGGSGMHGGMHGGMGGVQLDPEFLFNMMSGMPGGGGSGGSSGFSFSSGGPFNGPRTSRASGMPPGFHNF